MKLGFAAGLMAAAMIGAGTPATAATGERVQITGEIMDTWCYFSGVMGPAQITLGTAHHTCAMWCAAGGIPVGVLGDDGTVYMVLKLDGEGTAEPGEGMLKIQSHRVTADGMLYQRDGLNYLVVEEVVEDEGIVNETHADYFIVPPFAAPEELR